MRAYLGVMAAPVYCTRTASRLVRTYTDRHGLKELVKELLGQDLSKQQQTSDWGAPEISDAQREYAASDVRYLHRLKEQLDERLERERPHRAGPGLLRLPAGARPARPRRLGRGGHLRPCLKAASPQAARRARKRHWAEPGSRHDRLVKLAKIGLPVVGAALARRSWRSRRSTREGEVSFILDKNKVEQAAGADAGRGGALYRRPTTRRQQVRRSAPTARSSRPATSRSSTSRACARGSSSTAGPLAIAALNGRYNLDRKQIEVDGPVRVAGPDGYRLRTRDVDGRPQASASCQPAAGSAGAMRLGEFEAGRLSADLGARDVVLDGRVRLKIVQGAVR